MTREPYIYVILRYRHDPVAGEQINVGVVLFAPKSGYLAARLKKTYARAKKVFPDVDGTLLRQDFTRIERAFERLSKKQEVRDLMSSQCNATTFAQKVVGVDDASLVWSELGSGLAASPEKAVDELYARFVAQYDEQNTHRRDDADIWKPFRDLLLERRIADLFQPRTIRSPHNEVEFDHAWKNGKWHCIQPLSFDLTTEEGIQEKAARWVGNMFGLSKGDEAIKPYFLVGKPSDESMMPAYQRAMEFLHDAPFDPQIVPEQDMDRLVDELAEKIHAEQRGHEPLSSKE